MFQDVELERSFVIRMKCVLAKRNAGNERDCSSKLNQHFTFLSGLKKNRANHDVQPGSKE